MEVSVLSSADLFSKLGWVQVPKNLNPLSINKKLIRIKIKRYNATYFILDLQDIFSCLVDCTGCYTRTKRQEHIQKSLTEEIFEKTLFTEVN